MKRLLSSAVCAALLLLTGYEAPAAAAGPGFLNGPSILPNVFRFEDETWVGLGDDSTGLAAFAGLPADPAEICADSFHLNVMAFQTVGQLQAVFHVLILGDDVNIVVYELSDLLPVTALSDLCNATPIAAGTGRLVYTDNDYDVSGTRTNSFGAEFHGTLQDLEHGGPVHLRAAYRAQFAKDGTHRTVVVTVKLQ